MLANKATARKTGSRALHWKTARGGLLMPAPFLVAGILNVTPDSFSDGGEAFLLVDAVDKAERLIAEGAHIVDIGGESTRPGAKETGAVEEQARIMLVLDALKSRVDNGNLMAFGTEGAFSVDTWRADTALTALKHGLVTIVNDISGGTLDEGMVEVVAHFKPGYVLGHTTGKPVHMQDNAQYDNIVDDLLRYFEERLAVFVRAGLPEKNIAIDPCIGFGKNLEHNLTLMREAPRLLELGRPLYYGISRKSYLDDFFATPLNERDAPTQVATALLAFKGVNVHRVHDVAGAVRALRLAHELFPLIE